MKKMADKKRREAGGQINDMRLKMA